MMSKEIDKWNETKSLMGNEKIILGPHYSYVLKNVPRRLGFVLSHYKFAAKMIGEKKSVLEVGCSEGLGATLLAEADNKVLGIDIDRDAIRLAEKNFKSDRIRFKVINVLEEKAGSFDAVVSFDVIEHIYPENEDKFFKSVCRNLKKIGICVLGTPNKTAEQYSSSTSKVGHVNLYTWDRLKSAIGKYFDYVFLFSGNDEIIHTGFYPMAHYLIAMGVNKKVGNKSIL